MKIVWEEPDLKYGATASTEEMDYLIIGKDDQANVYGLLDEQFQFIGTWMTASETIEFLSKRGCDAIES